MKLHQVLLLLTVCIISFSLKAQDSEYRKQLFQMQEGSFLQTINSKHLHVLASYFKEHAQYKEFSEKLKGVEAVNIQKINGAVSLTSAKYVLTVNGKYTTELELTFDSPKTLIKSYVFSNPEVLKAENYKSGTDQYVKLSTRKTLTAKSTPAQKINVSESIKDLSPRYTEVNIRDIVTNGFFPAITYNYKDRLGQNRTGNYNVGGTISNSDIPSDIREGYADGSPFGAINDVTAYYAYNTVWGGNVPVGSLIVCDSKYKRLVFYNYGKEIEYYGHAPGEHKFQYPIAVEVVGNILYVLDGKTNTIAIFRIFLNTDNTIDLEYRGETDFELPLVNPTDIAGMEVNGNHLLLFIADVNGLHKVYCKNLYGGYPTAEEGFAITGDPIFHHDKITRIVHPEDNQKTIDLGGISKVEVSGNSLTTNVVMAVTEQGEVFTFHPEYQGENPEYFCFNTFSGRAFNISNISYNLGNQNWYASDYNGYIHTFSPYGNYIASFGQHGTNENSTDLYYPVGVVENNTTLNQDIVVASTWTENTGLKRFLPKIIVSGLSVIEQFLEGYSSKFYFNYSLGARPQGSVNITIKVNNSTIYSSPNDFSSSYTPHFLVSQDFLAFPGSPIANTLIPGWNTYKLEVGAPYNLTEQIDFQYFPDTTITPYNALDQNPDQPIYIYKNTNFKNTQFRVSKGKIIFFDDKTLSVSATQVVLLNEEEFYYARNSGFKIIDRSHSPIFISNCTFFGYGLSSALLYVEREANASILPDFYIKNCEFYGYSSAGLVLSRQTGVRLLQNKFTSNLSTAVGLRVYNCGTINLYGNEFFNNKIGIDAGNTSNLVLHEPQSVYLGSSGFVTTTINNLHDNYIGIYSNNTNVTAHKVTFKSNSTGIMHASGMLDLQTYVQNGNNDNNHFHSNNAAIVLAGDISMQNGANYFQGNRIDLNYLAAITCPPVTVGGITDVVKIISIDNDCHVADRFFNFECNKWDKPLYNSNNSPAFFVTYPPGYSEELGRINFDYKPYKDYSNNCSENPVSGGDNPFKPKVPDIFIEIGGSTGVSAGGIATMNLKMFEQIKLADYSSASSTADKIKKLWWDAKDRLLYQTEYLQSRKLEFILETYLSHDRSRTSSALDEVNKLLADPLLNSSLTYELEILKADYNDLLMIAPLSSSLNELVAGYMVKAFNEYDISTNFVLDNELKHRSYASIFSGLLSGEALAGNDLAVKLRISDLYDVMTADKILFHDLIKQSDARKAAEPFKVTGSDSETAESLVYPNPVTADYITLVLPEDFDLSQSYAVRIYDLAGREVGTAGENVVFNELWPKLPLKQKPPAGIYMLRITGNDNFGKEMKMIIR